MDKKALIYMCNDNKLKHYMKDIEKYCLDNQYYLDEKNIFIANKENLKSNLYPGNTLILGELCMLGEKVDEIKQELYLLKNNNINVVILNISNLLNRYLNNKNELNFDKIDLFVELIYLDIQTRVANNKRGRPKINLPSNFNKIYDEWKAGKITAVKAMDLLNLSKTTFYKFVKKYEESIFKDSLEFKSNTTNISKKNKFSYPNNAIITHFSIYLRDKFGNKLINELVLKPGTKITVLNINFENQLVLIEYLYNNKIKTGYIKNSYRTIKYLNENNYKNSNKLTDVYEINFDIKRKNGKILPNERATILYENNFGTYIVYNTKKGKNSKSGYLL